MTSWMMHIRKYLTILKVLIVYYENDVKMMYEGEIFI